MKSFSKLFLICLALDTQGYAQQVPGNIKVNNAVRKTAPDRKSLMYLPGAGVSDVICNPGADLGSAADDYIQFSLSPVAPTGYYTAPYTYTVTALQNGNPVVVSRQNGAPATNLMYSDIAEPLRLANGTSGQGDVLLTITPNWGSFTPEEVEVTDPGSCTTYSCGTGKTVTYTYTSPLALTDASSVQAIIPKFNNANGRTLTNVSIDFSSTLRGTTLLENRSASSTSLSVRAAMFDTRLLDLDGINIATNANDTINMTAGYPAYTTINAPVLVPPSGTWAGDDLSGPQPSTLSALFGSDWLAYDANWLGVDVTQDPRWVTYATGDTTTDDDMIIVQTNTKTINNTFSYNAGANPLEFAKFIGANDTIPLFFSSLTGLDLNGGGGNLIMVGLSAYKFTVSVTYTYTEECITLSGNVFNDGNGNTDNLVNHTTAVGTGIGTPDGIPLYANLINEAGKVVASVGVNGSTGAYSFSNIKGYTNYTVQISTIVGIFGAAAPAANLPANWRNTGEQWGTVPGTNIDVNTDGTYTVAVTNAAVTGLNFGIDKIPLADIKSYNFTATPPANTVIALDGTNSTYGPAPGLLSGMDAEDGTLGGANTDFVIVSLPTNGTLHYNGTVITATDVTNSTVWNNPALLSFQYTGSGYSSTTFTYAFVDEAQIKGTTNTYTITTISPLPLNLLSFTAASKDCNTLLQWGTAEEVHIKQFDVQYSTDSRNYVPVGVVASVAGAGGMGNYSFVHVPARGKAYYRLAIQDQDGSYTYSQVQMIYTDCNASVKIYPNPASTVFNVTGARVNELIQINDVTGKLLKTVVVQSENQAVDISSQPTGIYFVSVLRNGDSLVTIKIIKK